MTPSRHVTVRIDLNRVVQNAQRIAARTRVEVYAVVKADAYGLGAQQTARALADVVHGFYVFSVPEAIEAGLHDLTGKKLIVLDASQEATVEICRQYRLRPAVWSVQRALDLREARPILCLDTGMQRFACSPDQADQVLEAGNCDEAFTHAVRLEQVEQLVQVLGGKGLRLHAAGSALLDHPTAWLDAVRPGLALYENAVHVSTHLAEARSSNRPAGYSGFVVPRHGLILAGYSNGIRQAMCLINGTPRRVLEVGMQSTFVELGEKDKPGDQVILLGDGLTLPIAAGQVARPHELLLRLCASGVRCYR